MYALADAGKRGVSWVRRVTSRRALACAALSAPILALMLAACTVGPDYKPAAAPVPTKFKELKGWRLAAPSDALDRGNWWSLYRDAKLDSLLRQVEVSNQTIAAQAAASALNRSSTESEGRSLTVFADRRAGSDRRWRSAPPR